MSECRRGSATRVVTVKAVLGTQLDRNISTYIDDVIIQSKKSEDHIKYLHETFANLHQHGLN